MECSNELILNNTNFSCKKTCKTMETIKDIRRSNMNQEIQNTNSKVKVSSYKIANLKLTTYIVVRH